MQRKGPNRSVLRKMNGSGLEQSLSVRGVPGGGHENRGTRPMMRVFTTEKANLEASNMPRMRVASAINISL